MPMILTSSVVDTTSVHEDDSCDFDSDAGTKVVPKTSSTADNDASTADDASVNSDNESESVEWESEGACMLVVIGWPPWSWRAKWKDPACAGACRCDGEVMVVVLLMNQELWDVDNADLYLYI